MSRLFRHLALLTLSVLSLSAQDPDSPSPKLGLSPEEAADFLAKLYKLQDELAANTKEVISAALERICTASASESAAAELYLAAWKIIHIDRSSSPPPDTRDKDDWRSQQITWMKETGAQKGIRLQLAWLHLIIEAARTTESERAALLPKARAITQEAGAIAAQLGTLPSTGGDRRGGGPPSGMRDRMEAMRERAQRGDRGARDPGDFLTESVMTSLFAQAYHLQNHIQIPPDWSVAPLDLDAVYGRMLLPDARANRPAELPALWDERIQIEAALRRANLSETAFAEWGANQGRQLQWRKYLDHLQSGVNARAAGEELLKIFQENPAHPNRNDWRKDLERITAQLTGGQD